MIKEVIISAWKKLLQGRYPLVLLIFGVPLVFTLLFGAVYAQNTVKHIPMVIHDQDQSSMSRLLIQAYDDSERYVVQDYVSSQEEMEQALDDGEAILALEIPKDFARDVKAGNRAQTLLIVNSANNMFGNAALSSAQEINRTFSLAVGQKLMEAAGQLPEAAMATVYPVQFGVRILNNPTNGYTPFMLAGLMLNGLQISLLAIIPPLLVRECKYRQAKDKKVPLLSLLIGNALPCWAMAVLSFGISLAVVHLLFDVPMCGSWWEAFLLAGGFIYFVIGALFLFSACSPTEVLSLQMPMLYIMPGLLYSGLSWPPFAMDRLGGFISNIFPLTYTGDNLRDLMLSGYAPDLFVSVGKMFVLGTILSLLAGLIFYFRRRLNLRSGGAERGHEAASQA